MYTASKYQGIKKQGKRLSLFNSKTVWVQPFFYFQTLCALLRSRSTPRTWCLLRWCHGEAYLGALISVPCATDRSIGLPELRHCKCHFQTNPDVEIQKPNYCCVAPDGRKHVKLKKTGINKVSLSGACKYWVNLYFIKAVQNVVFDWLKIA